MSSPDLGLGRKFYAQKHVVGFPHPHDRIDPPDRWPRDCAAVGVRLREVIGDEKLNPIKDPALEMKYEIPADAPESQVVGVITEVGNVGLITERGLEEVDAADKVALIQWLTGKAVKKMQILDGEQGNKVKRGLRS